MHFTMVSCYKTYPTLTGILTAEGGKLVPLYKCLLHDRSIDNNILCRHFYVYGSNGSKVPQPGDTCCRKLLLQKLLTAVCNTFCSNYQQSDIFLEVLRSISKVSTALSSVSC